MIKTDTFIGRKEQLASLDTLYQSDHFEFLILYGQRRIGKTTLLGKYIENKKAIFFTAKETNDALNLAEFTSEITRYFSLKEGISFATWERAFEFIAEQSQGEKTIVVIDEYPYAAIAGKSLNSMLQIAIDHHLKHSKVKLILSGSHVSFMEKQVLGRKSPLFGRKTMAMQLLPFDYYETGLMLSNYSNIDKIRFYSVLGGIPYYLSLVDKNRSFEENLADLFFKKEGKLYDEPSFLMKEEFEQPAIYNAVIMAVAQGANRPNQIQQIAKIEANSTPFYLKTLTEIGFLEKKIPFGENRLTSRKGIYIIKDNTFRFWYQYVYANMTAIELGAGQQVMKQKILPYLDDFIGKTVFEDVAQQFLVRQLHKGKLPLLPVQVGKWWGTDNAEKRQTDIDVVFSDEHTALLGECKWRNNFSEIEEIQKLMKKDRLLPNYQDYLFYFFAKHPFQAQTISFAKAISNLKLVSLEDMFECTAD